MVTANTDTPNEDTRIPSLSKNKLKKLRRDEEWEAGRAARKEKRKLKIKEKKEKQRAARNNESLVAIGTPSRCLSECTSKEANPMPRKVVQLPVTFIIDCDYDNLMNDKERNSLASQITRCYSENQKSSYRSHIAISSFDGLLKARFEGPLGGNYQSWKGVRFLQDNFVDVAEQAKEWMATHGGAKLEGALGRSGALGEVADDRPAKPEVVYLTSDSADTLAELKPHGTYILGGLVDRNRHKGICHKSAMSRGVRTAKLPIGDYIQMNSRSVLTVNHVLEILLRWLQLGDWSQALLEVIPKRKGGVLKDITHSPEDSDESGERGDGGVRL